MHSEDYKSVASSIQQILGKTVKEISNESTDEYRKSLEKIAKDRQLKSLSKKDKETLIKIANLMKSANEALDQGDEAKVKEIIDLLRKASDSHAKQADDLQKAVDEADTVAGDVADAPKPFLKKKEDEDEVNEVKNTDKYRWPDINKALMGAGVKPTTILKVVSFLRGKEI
jgi:ABC-type transporter Mla subunit MlaD